MNAKDVLRSNLDASDRIIGKYIEDLADAELLVRPIDGMNNIAWQLGHLIGSERHMLELIRPGSSPELPDGFQDGHGRQSFTENEPSKFYPLARYRELWDAQRAATRALLASIPEEELDRADSSFPPIAPTVGALFGLIGGHALMHCGQFVAVRRKLGKPVAI